MPVRDGGGTVCACVVEGPAVAGDAILSLPVAFAPGLLLYRTPAGPLRVLARGPESPPEMVAGPGEVMVAEALPGPLAEGLARLVSEAEPAGAGGGCRRLLVETEAGVVELVVGPVDDAGGRPVQLREVGRAARLERDLARAREELQQFAYAASHDLQEPLRTVAGFCELLRRRYRGRLDADADTFIDFAVDGARRMQALLRALLDFSRVETRGGPLVPVALGPLVAEVAEGFRPLVAELGGTLEIGPLPAVRGDPPQLARLFRELLDNAVRYRGEAPPRITVSGHGAGTFAEIAVRDAGIGIPPEFHERIFRIFQRLHSRDEIPGTGAGLAICRRIVERHGGGIAVESAPGRGAVFTVRLPRADEGTAAR